MEFDNKIQLCIVQNGKIAFVERNNRIQLPSGHIRKGETRIIAATRIGYAATGLKVRILPISYTKKNKDSKCVTILAYPVSERNASRNINVLWKNYNNLESLDQGLKKDIIKVKQYISKADIIKRSGLLVYKKQKDKIKFLVISSLMNPNRFIIPQGHVEDGENYEDAAIRETEEEAGVHAEITEKLGFFFLERGKNIYQTHIYLAKFCGNVSTEENRIVKWMSYEELIKKDILRETKIFLKDIYCNKKRRRLLK